MGVAWLYGVKNFLQDIRDMSIPMPRLLSYFWTCCWVLITPLLIFVIICIGFATRELDSRDGYVYPPAAQALGWLIEMAPVAIVVISSIATMLLRLCNRQQVSFSSLFKPSGDWGPREDRPASAIPVAEENLAFYKSIGDDSISDVESVGDVTDAGSVAHSVEYSVNEKAVKSSGQESDDSSTSQAGVGDGKIHPEREKDDGNTSESTVEERT